MRSVDLRVDDPLRPFLRRARGSPTLRIDGTSTLVHLVESVGIPRTEIGRYLADGQAVEPAYPPRGGESIRVVAVERPQPAPTTPPRFVADVHLGALVRRLRLLGVDVAYRTDASDDALLAQACESSRVLLTKDRGLLSRRQFSTGLETTPMAEAVGAFVYGSGADAQVADVIERFDPPLVPYTRCPRCNGTVTAVPKTTVAKRLPAGTRRSYDDFARCGACGQVYWRGAHATALDAIIATARAAPG